MAGRYTDQHPQFSDSNGVPLADGQVEFFTVGNTGDGNRKDTYSDPELTTPNTNPALLDGSGRSVSPIFLDGSYNTIIRDVNLVQIDQVDNVSAPSSSEGVPSQVVNLVADLKPIDTNSFQEAYVLGTTVIGDGGQGHFFFSSSSTESDNGLNIIEPDAGGGRWLLQNNSHNSITTAQAAGTTDAITIATSPLSTALDAERIFFVENTLGANTITGVTFKVDATSTLTLKRNNTTALVAGDTGPIGYKMLIQILDDDSAYILINPFKVATTEILDKNVTNAKLADMVQSTIKGRAASSGTGAPIDLTSAQGRAALGLSETSAVGFGLGYRSGLTIDNGTDASHDIDINVGSIMDSTNAERMALSSLMTKRIDAVWSAGTGNGGRASAVSLSNNTWYRVFLIENSSGTVDAGFDTSSTAANLLTDSSYSFFRRIGYVLTNGSANIISWVLGGDREYMWDVPVSDEAASSTTTTGASITVTAPPAQTAILSYILLNDDTTTLYGLLTKTAQTNSAVTALTAQCASAATALGTAILNITTDSSSQIRHRESSTTTAAFSINAVGWVDNQEVA